MARTTLVTFIFDCPTSTRTVELLGSWDNFSKPYPLKRDKRKDPRTWTGCFTFDNIICDGDLVNAGEKRSGALLMGGTYWYYYKVDDEEQHNPSQPSTTVCPVLPGQRLNVLEVPIESRSRSNSGSSAVFTRNPEDKYRPAVPPKSMPSPKTKDSCQDTPKMTIHRSRSPRSATYPPPERLLPPHFAAHTRSASTSPNLGSNASFADFRLAKEKLVTKKRSASSSRGRSKERKHELQISAPKLLSSTTEDPNLVPLCAIRTPKICSSLPPSIAARMRGYAPLGMNPVDLTPEKDLGTPERKQSPQRPSSTLTPASPTHLTVRPSRIRANSADTRRTRHYVYANEPWISSPKFWKTFQDINAGDGSPSVVQRLSNRFHPAELDGRPSSSHGGDWSSGLRGSPLDKKLPALPGYASSEPLSACDSEPGPVELDAKTFEDAVELEAKELIEAVELEAKERKEAVELEAEELKKAVELEAKEPEDIEVEIEEDEDEDVEILEAHPVHVILPKLKSHFSVWSADSTFSCPRSDDGTLHSPTFSSLSSGSSEPPSPQPMSDVLMESDCSTDATYATDEDHAELRGSRTPKLRLPVPSFGPSLFQIDIQCSDDVPRRQAACYGYPGFQGYSLPDHETSSEVTIKKAAAAPEPCIASHHNRMSSVSQLEKLMNEFGYLGDSVV